jgi:hypothetical protein
MFLGPIPPYFCYGNLTLFNFLVFLSDNMAFDHISKPLGAHANVHAHRGSPLILTPLQAARGPPQSFQRAFSLKYTPSFTSSALALKNYKDITSNRAFKYGGTAKRGFAGILELLFSDWWLGEIILWILSAACLIIMTGLLAKSDGKSLPAQASSSISINTMVSILSTLSRFALSVPVEACLGQLKWGWFRNQSSRQLIDLEKFDKASRGPWGSFCFLLHNKFR